VVMVRSTGKSPRCSGSRRSFGSLMIDSSRCCRAAALPDACATLARASGVGKGQSRHADRAKGHSPGRGRPIRRSDQVNVPCPCRRPCRVTVSTAPSPRRMHGNVAGASSFSCFRTALRGFRPMSASCLARAARIALAPSRPAQPEGPVGSAKPSRGMGRSQLVDATLTP